MKRTLLPLADGLRRAALRAETQEFMRHLVSENYAAVIQRLDAVEQAIAMDDGQVALRTGLEAIRGNHEDYEELRAAADDHQPMQQLVTQHFDAMLAAYSQVVRTAGYYLRAVDLTVYADAIQHEIEIFRAGGLGQFERVDAPQTLQEEQRALNPLGPVAAPPTLRVFHAGAHYERAVLNAAPMQVVPQGAEQPALQPAEQPALQPAQQPGLPPPQVIQQALPQADVDMGGGTEEEI